MKNLLTAFSLILLFTACSTSTEQDPDRIGTWRIDSPEHATWMGGDETASNMAYYVAADSTDPDSTITMVYPNSDFSVEMTEEVFSPNQANVSLNITDMQIPQYYTIDFRVDTTMATLGDNFIKSFGNRSLSLGDSGYEISPTYLFDCDNPIQPSEGTLKYILSITYPQSGDTLSAVFEYKLRLKGVQQAAKRVACN